MISRVIVSFIVLSFALPAFAAGDAAVGKGKSQVCAGCHGVDGNATIPNYPKLAGQHANYLVSQMQAFKSGKRNEAIMKGQVANLKEQDMQDLAAYFASQKTTIGAASDKDKREFGERLYRGGNETKGISACMACHGPNGSGNKPAGFPALGGQNAAYTAKSLTDYRAGKTRAFDDKDEAGKIMHNIAKRMSDDEIEAVSHYISGLN
ncbi:Cytochrome c4 [hydrothermal vent metagenome]|uniref:Cytochrome c4 n=1 Tax=hydrothermal vent metagenome TaxID=652676 RepID=A0A3B1AQ26_9ZZZZ